MGEATSRPDKVVGFHFFYPASVMRLIEVVEGDDTSAETAQAAANFAQAIRKTPIRCAEAPGFVVNRILTSAASELWRVPGGVRDRRRGARPARRRLEGRADRPVLPRRPARPRHRAARRRAPAATPTASASTSTGHARARRRRRPRREDREGLLRARRRPLTPPPRRSGRGRFTLKAFVESCLVLEEGVASIRDIDLGMMAGAGIIPPPFARADQVRARRGARAASSAPRGVGRGVRAAGDPAPAGRAGPARRQVRARASSPTRVPTRAARTARSSSNAIGQVAIAWLDRPPANSISPEVGPRRCAGVWDEVDRGRQSGRS